MELPQFTRQITGLVADDAYLEFQKELLQWPTRGAVIPHSCGLRKARMALAGRGKRGGARVIYLHLPEHEVIVLFYAYTKAENENIGAEALSRLRAAVALIKQEFRHEAKRH